MVVAEVVAVGGEHVGARQGCFVVFALRGVGEGGLRERCFVEEDAVQGFE